MQDELDVATLLSVEAVQIDPSVEARGSLLATLTIYPHLTNVLHGHQQEMLTAVFSSDGHHLATGDAAGEVLLWEITDSKGTPRVKIIHRLSDHTERVTSLAFSPDGQLLASGSFDDTIVVWNVTTGKSVSPLFSSHTGNVNSLAFSPNGDQLVSTGADGQGFFWDIRIGSARFGQVNQQFTSPGRKPISSLAVSPDWRLLAYGLEDGSIILWDIEGSRPRGDPLVGHDRNIRSLAFSPDGQWLASGSDDRRIMIWDTGLNSIHFGEPVLAPLEGHHNWVTSLTFNPVSRNLTSTDKDGLALVWDLSHPESGRIIPTPSPLIDGHVPLWGLDYAPNGKWLVTNGSGNSTVLMDITRIHPLVQAQTNSQDLVRDMTFSPDGRILATADHSGYINLWDGTTGLPLIQPIKADPCCLNNILFSPDGLTLASAGADDLVHLWNMDLDSKEFGQALNTILYGHLTDVTALAFHPQQPILVTGDIREIIFWDVDPDSKQFGKPLFQFENPPGITKSIFYRLSFEPSGDRLDSFYLGEVVIQDISALLDQLNNPQEEREISEIPQLFSFSYDAYTGGSLSTIIFDIDSAHTKLISIAFNEIRSWDLNPDFTHLGKLTGTSIGTMVSRINTILIGPDGNFLVSGDMNGQIQFWDLSSRSTIGPPIASYDSINAFAFSPDGHTLASGGAEGSIVLWDLRLDSWITQACQRANRNLTQEEWRRFFGEEPYRATCPGV